MGRLYYVLPVWGFFALLALPAGDGAAEGAKGRIVRHIDGDTTEVALEGDGRLKVRLLGIDAPETDHGGKRPDCRGQPYGALSLAAINGRAPAGSAVEVRIKTLDRYGRSLGTLFLDGEELNLWMVRNGWAEAYADRGGGAYRLAEREAKAQKAGIWATGEERPKDYRKRCRR